MYKKNKILLGIFLICTFLTGCDGKQTEKSLNIQNEKEKVANIVTLPLVQTHPLDIYDIETFINDKYINQGFRILGEYVWSNESTPTAIILLTKADDTCHICQSKLISIVYKYFPNNNWKMIGETNLGEFGENGYLPKPIFTKLGTNKYGFLMNLQHDNGGYFSKSIALFTIMNNKTVYCGNLEDTKESNFGQVGEDDPEYFSVSSNITFIANSKNEFYDIRVDSMKKTNIKNKPLIKKTIHYHFNGKEYVVASSSK